MWKIYRSLLLVPVMGGLASGQQSFNITSFNFPFTTTTSTTYTTSLTSNGAGVGTATITGTSLSTQKTDVDGIGVMTRERGLNCGDVIQLSLNFPIDANDVLTIVASGPYSAGATSVTLDFYVTGSTGIFKARRGTGTINATVSQNGSVTTFTGSGSAVLDDTKPLPTFISPSGIVPVFSATPIIQPGSWISIYGSNFVSANSTWNGDFPTSLGGVSVTINGKNAYLWFVSPQQINVQAPDDSTQGCVPVVVKTPNATATGAVILQSQQPSLSLYSGTQYAIGVIPTPNLSGGYSNGAYDLAGPIGGLGFGATRPAKVGETVELFGVGFGPVQVPVPAGQADSYSKPNYTNYPISVTVGGVPASVTFAGEILAGLYQINIVVPQVPKSGDQIVIATIPGAQNPVLFSADATQNCQDPASQALPSPGCSVYLSVQ